VANMLVATEALTPPAKFGLGGGRTRRAWLRERLHVAWVRASECDHADTRTVSKTTLVSVWRILGILIPASRHIRIVKGRVIEKRKKKKETKPGEVKDGATLLLLLLEMPPRGVAAVVGWSACVGDLTARTQNIEADAVTAEKRQGEGAGDGERAEKARSMSHEFNATWAHV
jgi:hypothetical protein